MLLVCAVVGVLVATPWSSAQAAEDTEEPKAIKHEPTQAEDTDTAKDKSLLSKQPADEAVAKKGEADNAAFYEKWQFWAITGGVVVGIVGLVLAGRAISHQMNGGDVRPCNMAFIGCFGEGQ